MLKTIGEVGLSTAPYKINDIKAAIYDLEEANRACIVSRSYALATESCRNTRRLWLVISQFVLFAPAMLEESVLKRARTALQCTLAVLKEVPAITNDAERELLTKGFPESIQERLSLLEAYMAGGNSAVEALTKKLDKERGQIITPSRGYVGSRSEDGEFAFPPLAEGVGKV